MSIIKLHSRGEEVATLQKLLSSKGYSIDCDGIFGKATESAVKRFQQSVNLVADGIVGDNTWSKLKNDAPDPLLLKETDFERAAQTLDVDTATVKAVREVESGRYGGFFKSGSPSVLFEGHIFWRELKKAGISPEEYVAGNEDILYPKWDRSHYIGGIQEHERLSKAIKIHRDAACKSASWGLFQIMGFNHTACGCNTIEQFVERMNENEGAQLDLFVSFIQSNKLDKFLRDKNWAEFARRYNGPAYAENKYDEKLERAYLKYHL